MTGVQSCALAIYALEGDFKAGDLPKASALKAEIMGLAVFNGGKMVGELDGEETHYHLMSNGEFRNAFMTIPDPTEKDTFVVIDVKQSRPPSHKVSMINGKPHIDLKIMLEGDIEVIQSGINYEEPQKLTELEKAYEDFIRQGTEKFLKKTTEYNADICGFGEHMKKKFLTWQKWVDFKWLDRYRDSSFNVEVDVKLRRPGLLVTSSPIEKSEE